MDDYDAIVVGGGIGGLAAAAGLRKQGLSVVVCERRSSLGAGAQGYRINIDHVGDGALRVCLDDRRYALHRQVSHQQLDPSVDIFTPDLVRVLHRTAASGNAGQRHAQPPSAVDRSTLRAILADGAGTVLFGHTVQTVTETSTGACVHLDDGTIMRAALVVAADGSASAVRRALLPGNDPVPLGLVATYGRTPIDLDATSWLPRGVLQTRFVGVTDLEGTTLALGAWLPRCVPSVAAARLVPELSLPDVAPYVMWALMRPTRCASSLDASAERLHDDAVAAIAGWNRSATEFVINADIAATFCIPLRATADVPRDPLARLVFIGDAIHTMSPAGGEGANTALADAAALSNHIARNGLARLERFRSDLRRRARSALARSATYGTRPEAGS